MQFHDYSTLYDVSRRIGKRLGKKMPDTYIEYYKQFKLTSIQDIHESRISRKDAVVNINQCLAEIDYINNNRPYYIVYPTITKYLINLKEEKVPVNLIKLPHRAIAFRFADTENAFDFQYDGKTYKLRTVFATYTRQEEILRLDHGTPIDHDIMILWIDIGETQTAHINPTETIELPVLTYKILHLNTPGKTLEESIEESKKGEVEGLRIPEEILTNIIRCIASCCLISKDMDDDLIEPDVLTADRDKFHETRDPKYIEKAKRRGKNGFLIGASLTISPHWRSGSPIALYWTGPGRTVPLYRPRKGALVHRKKIQELPTGYEEPLTDQDPPVTN